MVESLPERFRVVALAAGGNIEELAGQIARHRPELVSVSDAAKAAELRERLGQSANGLPRLPEIQHGREGLLSVATHPDAAMVVSAAVGVVGLEATYAAVRAGKRVALSNKEVLVAAGELVMAAVKAKGVELLPVDSEHNAIHQCLRGGQTSEVRRLILTASGGPFRQDAARADGRRRRRSRPWHIQTGGWASASRIDSATLVNKGFEVIEAHWLFGMRPEQIDVVIHPQSTIHSMVEYVDGSILAQLGPTDMRMPIQYALTYPERAASNGVELDWEALRRLDFEKVSPRKFPCLRLARAGAGRGRGATLRLECGGRDSRCGVPGPQVAVSGHRAGDRSECSSACPR